MYSVLTDKWIVLPEDVNTGYCEIETVTRGTDVPERGYFVAYAYAPDAQLITDEHNRIVEMREGLK